MDTPAASRGSRARRRLAPAAGAVGVCVLALVGIAAAQRVGQPAGEPPSRPTAAQTCVGSCHQDILDRKVMHGPAVRDCATCHVLVDADEHTFAYPMDVADLCVRCHSLAPQNVTHEPVRQGKCLECHDPHGSDHPSALLADPNRDLCGRCHRDDVGNGEFVHGPVVVGACVVCHEPHASREPSLLRQNELRTCLTCHEEVDPSAQAGWHVHGALQQGCVGCHDPHSSDHEYQLRATAPDLCLTCHRDQIERTLEDAKVVHGAVMEEGGCTTCHEPHKSRLPSLQSDAQPAICLDCHDEQLQTPKGEVLTNMASLLERNPDHHGPIREGSCTACHQAHAGDHFRLLTEDYPPEFYAPFSMETFKLCFRCHIPDLVLKENGRGLTRFRDGTKNLHWVHVNQEKGRTCRACHEVHASKRPAHIREAVPFGSTGWMLEINFDQTEGGGSCTPACHQQRTYTRGDDVQPPAPTSTGAQR